MSRSLNELFDMLYNSDDSCSNGKRQEDLFGYADVTPAPSYKYEKTDLQIISDFYSGNFDLSLLNESGRSFFELSIDAFDVFINAWMSELPIEKELLAFGRRIIAAEKTGADPDAAAVDRGDLETIAVLKAAQKTQREYHRMQGLFRFSPDENGAYIARCATDHLIVPMFGGYLTARFGETAWALIDEKRFLCLFREPPEQAKIVQLKTCEPEKILPFIYQSTDEWEELWKHYHKTINNESRNNAGLQRQLMPKRYWKYLPEV